MARPRIVDPRQPWLIRAVLALLEFFASLQLAVILIFSAAFVLAAATFIESNYGTPAVKFGMYGTWWFGLLNALLALNIFCAAAIRFPWKRYQTGFVITHIGLLTLLFGCLLSRIGGIDAQMPIYEGHSGQLAYESTLHAEVSVEDVNGNSASQQVPVVSIPLRMGPFNWRDYGTALRPLPWNLAGRNHRGQVLHDRDGVKLEVLDFYSDSRVVDAPHLTVKLTTGEMAGTASRMVPMSVPVELAVRQVRSEYQDRYPLGIGEERRMGGGSLLFWMVSGSDEAKAFLEGIPAEEGDQGSALGTKGAVALYVGGTIHRFLVEDHSLNEPFALGQSGLKATVTRVYEPSSQTGPGVDLKLEHEGGDSAEMKLFAEIPHTNIHDRVHGVYGYYWYDQGEKSSEQLIQGEGSSRIDIVYSPSDADSGKLYYRYWNRKRVVAAGELLRDGSSVDAFQMPFAKLKLVVDELIPAETPMEKRVPIEFDKDKAEGIKHPAALFRLTVDGRSEESWVEAMRPDLETPPRAREFAELVGGDRRLMVTMPFDTVDVGFKVHLDKFNKQLDPGTDQPSHYSSVVDLVDAERGDKMLRADVLITMNAPIDFRSPVTGKSYRLFQESFFGPFSPYSPEYRALAKDTTRDELYASVLTVNYDPGRGTKYAGCLFIVGGIATMFYMKAYFFGPKKKPPTDSMAVRRPAEPTVQTRETRTREPVVS